MVDEMFASLTDKRIISLMLSTYEKYPTKSLLKKMTKTILKKATNLSLSTIKNYLNNYPELKEIYQSIKENSGTVKQRKQKEYNTNKKRVA